MKTIITIFNKKGSAEKVIVTEEEFHASFSTSGEWGIHIKNFGSIDAHSFRGFY